MKTKKVIYGILVSALVLVGLAKALVWIGNWIVEADISKPDRSAAYARGVFEVLRDVVNEAELESSGVVGIVKSGVVDRFIESGAIKVDQAGQILDMQGRPFLVLKDGEGRMRLGSSGENELWGDEDDIVVPQYVGEEWRNSRSEWKEVGK